ncbi:MAG TPA: NAD(P)/FAD-dependent oxidoreductase [Longimicrobiaceae bacterium]|nr:NAD(P)/FAD-dependent oxidoreductase [Longimicrobiaceae bacterium]
MTNGTGGRPRVVVVGGGFGGLWAARALARLPVQVTLIDRRNHHLFQPLLYQVATAALSPADIATPIRSILHRQANVQVLLAEVNAVDVAARTVHTVDGRDIAYDFLIVSSGATHAYFGHPEWEPLAPGLKTVEDATELRKRFLLAFEAAEQEPDAERRRALLTFAVVGAGPTGVEMAGAMAEVAGHALVRDFRHVDPSSARVILLEGGPRVLASYDADLSRKAEAALREKGVEVRTGAIVTRIDAEAVYVGDERIPASNVMWAAGVTASPLGAALGVPTDRVGRVHVQPDLSVPGHPEVFVIGDLASLNGADGRPLPGVAQVAMQMGEHAAHNIGATLDGVDRKAFRYRDKGNLATIGRRAAVFQKGRTKLFGWIAWMLWLFVHVYALIGFRNRISVMIQWAWSYLTWQRGARLITGDTGDASRRRAADDRGVTAMLPDADSRAAIPASGSTATGGTPEDGASSSSLAGDRDPARAAR